MITEQENTRLSKFLSLVLRHKPETIGIRLDDNGWTNVDELIEKMNKANMPIDFNTSKYVVETNTKKRFAFDETFERSGQTKGIQSKWNSAIRPGYHPISFITEQQRDLYPKYWRPVFKRWIDITST
jgi:hypothetical protein